MNQTPSFSYRFPVLCAGVRVSTSEGDRERLKLSVDLSQSMLSLSLWLFLFSRHTTQFQTWRKIWKPSSPPLSVNSHSLTFTSRHSSCGLKQVYTIRMPCLWLDGKKGSPQCLKRPSLTHVICQGIRYLCFCHDTYQ